MEMKNEIQEFVNEKLGLKVKCIQNEDGSISMKLSDTAIGYGWVKTANSGNQVIRWSRVGDYLKEYGVTTCGHEDFIPESMFYLLGMKASNESAKRFQMWLATEVIPSIRKHGAFVADSENVDSEYKYKSSDRLPRHKSVEKGLQQLHDRLAKEDISNVGDCYNIRKLKERVILDRTTLEKRISGGIRAAKTKEIASLKGNDTNE